MKGFKLNIESVNCVLLVVILALVVVCCVKKPTEGFWGWKKINYRKLCKKYNLINFKLFKKFTNSLMLPYYYYLLD